MLIVTAAMVLDRGQILISKRSGAKRSGLWEFPGGKIESGETPQDALTREIREELGVTIEVGPAYDVIHHVYPDIEVLILFYLCRITEGTPSPLDGVKEVIMAPLASLNIHPFVEVDQGLVEWIASHPDAFIGDCCRRWSLFKMR